MEAQLEAEVLEIIQRSNCMDSIECFATHRVTWRQLQEMDGKDLERIGIYRLGDRKRLLDETKKGATGILCKANAPDEKHLESNADSPSASGFNSATAPVAPVTTPSPTQQENVGDIDEENECCICMDARRQLVFLPCGHVCCCRACGEPIAVCPLCRVQIDQKINIFR